MRFMDKQEFTERFLHDQEERKLKASKPKTRKQSVLPFKEETYLDIINLFRELYGENVQVTKDKDVEIEYNKEVFSIKIVAKRSRVAI